MPRHLKKKKFVIALESRHRPFTVFEECELKFTFEPFYYTHGKGGLRLNHLTDEAREVFPDGVRFVNCSISTPSALHPSGSEGYIAQKWREFTKWLKEARP